MPLPADKQKTAVAHLVAKARKHAEASMSPNTRRTYSSLWRSFTSWCAANNQTSLPAAPGTVGLFITSEADKGRSIATIRTALAAIQAAHLEAGHEQPGNHAEVKKVMRGISKEKGTRQSQAAPICENHIQRVLATVGRTARDRRDLALLLVGRDILARRSELVAMDVSDFNFNEDGTGTALIRRSKTDQTGEGTEMFISKRTVEAVQAWIEAAGIEDGAAFRRVRRGDHPTHHRLSADSVADIFRRLIGAAGVDSDGVSGHSCRVGMAQDLVISGFQQNQLMTAGRWKSSTMVSRYTERQQASRGAVAQYYENMAE